MAKPIEKRTWYYAQRPAIYGISPCECGNEDTDWSEYCHMVWCQRCRRDFFPPSNGLFDGPISVHACAMMGIFFDRVDLETGLVEKFCLDSGNKIS